MRERPLSSKTQAVLLITAPLIIGRGMTVADLQARGLYKRLAQALREQRFHPSNLPGPDGDALCAAMAWAWACAYVPIHVSHPSRIRYARALTAAVPKAQ
jgi:hypothetical protein